MSETSKKIEKRNASSTINIKKPNENQNITENFFNFAVENEPAKPTIINSPKKPEEVSRRSSYKIIQNSGLSRNIGFEEKTGFSMYISNKTSDSLGFLKNKDKTSVITSTKLKNSENLPMNSILLEVFPSLRYHQPSLENPPNIENHDKIVRNDETQAFFDNERFFLMSSIRSNIDGTKEIYEKGVKNENFMKNSKNNENSIKNEKNSRIHKMSKEDCEKLNDQLTEKLMQEMLEFNIEKKPEMDDSNKSSKQVKKTVFIRSNNKEKSTFLESPTKNKDIFEEMQKIPSKREILNEDNKKKEEIKINKDRSASKNKPKIGISEADFVKISSKTQINEKLIHANFLEKHEDNTILDEDLMNSSNTSLGLIKENDSSKKINNNQFLGFIKEEKRDNYFGKERRNNEDNKVKNEILKNLGDGYNNGMNNINEMVVAPKTKSKSKGKKG